MPAYIISGDTKISEQTISSAKASKTGAIAVRNTSVLILATHGFEMPALPKPRSLIASMH